MSLLHSIALLGTLVTDSLHLEIVVPDSVRAGTPVPITLRLTNTGTRAVTVYLQGRPPAFDITVSAADGSVVWRRLEKATVTAILGVRTLQPGESVLFEDVWPQRSNRGAPVPPGDYAVVGRLPGEGRESLTTAPASLRILPADPSPK